MASSWGKLRCNCFKLHCFCGDSSQRQPQSPASQIPGQQQGQSSQASTSSPSAAVPFQANISELKTVLDYLDQVFDKNGQQQGGQVAVPDIVKNNLKHAEKAVERVREQCLKDRDGQGLVGDIAAESGRVLRDILTGVGNLHWAMAGLLLIATVTERRDQMSSNTVECFNILADLRRLGHHLVSLLQGIPEGDPTVQEATALVVEGVILCLKHSESSGPTRFGFVNVHKSNLSTLRERITRLYPRLVLTTLDRQLSKPLQPFPCRAPEDTVGLDIKSQEVLKLLRVVGGKVEAGVQAILLVGMGGIGKTTLGKAVCSQLPFTDRNFAKIEVGGNPSKETICNCQSDILERLSGEKQRVKDFEEGREKLKKYIASISTPVLLFLDNVFHENHLEQLIPVKLTIPDGSRIIVTSRDRNFSGAFSKIGIDLQIYPVQPLGESLAKDKYLLKHHLGEHPPDKEDQVNSVLQSCDGLPLAIELIGRRLKRKKDNESAWSSAVKDFRERLHTAGNKEDNLQWNLKLSYDDLSLEAQAAFLDVSCLLRSVPWDWVQTVFGSLIDDLEDLSLVKKDDARPVNYATLWDLGRFRYVTHVLRATLRFKDAATGRASGMGPSIHSGKGPCIHSGKGPSILAGSKARVTVHDVLATFGEVLSKANGVTRLQAGEDGNLPSSLQEGTKDKCENVEGIVIRGRRDSSKKPLVLVDKLDATCERLRILILERVDLEGICSEVPSRLQICSTPEKFPFKDLSRLDELCVLEIGGDIDFDFELVQFPKALEILKLSRLKMVRRFHEEAFERCLFLHTFEVQDCNALEELPASLCKLEFLRELVALQNKALRSIPQDFCRLVSLQTIILGSAWDKGEFLVLGPKDLSGFTRLENLALSRMAARQLPDGLGNLRSLKRLDILGLGSMKMLSGGFGNLSALTEMYLIGCQELGELPSDFGNLHALRVLRLEDCLHLAGLPDSFSQLLSLEKLTLTQCRSLKKLPQGFGELASLFALTLTGCDSLCQLSDDFGELKSLRQLEVRGCGMLTKLPVRFGELEALSGLTLEKCASLCQLPADFAKLKSLRRLELFDCKMLTELPARFGELASLFKLTLTGCGNLCQLSDDFGELKSLRMLKLEGCEMLTNLPIGFGELASLSKMTFRGCSSLTNLPVGFGELEALSKLIIDGCANLCELPNDFGELKSLTTLQLIGCKSLKELPTGFAKLNLSILVLEGCETLQRLPEDFVRLQSLIKLKLIGCKSLEGLPKGFGNLIALNLLRLEDLATLEKLPTDFGNLNSLRFLSLRGCQKLDASLEVVFMLKSLEVLDIRGWKIEETHDLEELRRMVKVFIAYEEKDYWVERTLPKEVRYFLRGLDGIF